MKNILILVMASSFLAACGGGPGSGSGSALNPFNWGNPERKAERQARRKSRREGAPIVIVDDRPFVSQIKELRGDVTKGGIILRATGLTERQGYHSPVLVPLNEGLPNENGQLIYEFRVQEPTGPVVISSDRSRELQVATFISNQKLRSIRSVQVLGRSNSRTVQRR